MIKITLTDAEIELAAGFAARDFIQAIHKKQFESHKKKGTQAEWLASRILGQWGEFGVRKAAGLPFDYHDIHDTDRHRGGENSFERRVWIDVQTSGCK